jgi:sporulation protein YlmC with PRC-barrel domain
VSHLVVKMRATGDEYRVPVSMIMESSSQYVLLRCTEEEIQAMPDFVQTEYVEMPAGFHPSVDFLSGASQHLLLPYALPLVEGAAVQTQMVPPEELAVSRGTRVRASDGDVGTVDELLVSPVDYQISHLILRKEQLLRDKDITIPVSKINKIEDGTVYLDMERAAIDALPVVAVRRPWE